MPGAPAPVSANLPGDEFSRAKCGPRFVRASSSSLFLVPHSLASGGTPEDESRHSRANAPPVAVSLRTMHKLFAVSLLPMSSLFLPMWIAIHMGRNRELIGSKETAKSLCIADEERAGPQGRRPSADAGRLPSTHHKLLNRKHLQRHLGPWDSRSSRSKAQGCDAEERPLVPA
jgi:hypothetical protein